MIRVPHIQPNTATGGRPIDLFDTLFVPYAITRHYDGMHQNNYITTSTFADGLGRALQTKKSSVVHENGQTSPKWVVSGKVYYDGLGRTVKAWQPITDTSAAEVFIRLTDPLPPTIMAYDAMDRQTTVYIPSGATSYVTNEYEYGFGPDGFGHTRLKTTVTDANSISSDQYTDPRGLQTMVVAAGMATTQFVYNAMGELIESIDPENNSTTYSYDMFGRVTQRNHPDAGTTIWRYDNAGNLRAVKTANLAGINDSITYNYDQGRLTHIHYPVNPEMDVYYEYGDPSAGNQAGRITRMQDASGVQQFSYGKLGEVIENIRTFVLPGGSETYTFKMQWEYDSWNRIKQMTYPDGEVVSYQYDLGGQLFAMSGYKDATPYPIIDSIFYDKFGSRAYIAYGNGTNTQYDYEPYRRRLAGLQTFSGSSALMDLTYSYDEENNITGISNSAFAVNGLGGNYGYNYEYDAMYRLTGAYGGSFTDNNRQRFHVRAGNELLTQR
jgi:YD repeat-containing protein